MDVLIFHAFKHHFKFGSDWLESNSGKWNDAICKDLKSLGSSLLDYYFGLLSAEQIKEEVLAYLSVHKLEEKEVYSKWIDSNNGFREINLSDGSMWTLRFIEKPQFVHIHPSRHSPHTMRIKANILKTVLCYFLFEDRMNFTTHIPLINNYRVRYLGLSPIKEGTYHTELENVFSLFYL